MTTILPLTYIGDIGYYARLLAGGCTIDIHENWVKQSMRNRTRIISSAGPVTLSVDVRGRGSRMLTTEVQTDPSRRWQHRHWMSIISAYGKSPFFDYYRDAFEPLYRQPFGHLAELDMLSMRTVMQTLGLDRSLLKFSDRYIPAGECTLDLRPKRAATMPDEAFEPYVQVFSDRMPFAANLSVMDLIFSEGPGAADYILQLSRTIGRE